MAQQRRSIDWDAQPLGDVPDRVIAERLGVGVTTVHAARAARGIPCHAHTHVRPDWRSVVGLGVLPDAVVADRLGVSRGAVSKARNRLGIPAPRHRQRMMTTRDAVDVVAGLLAAAGRGDLADEVRATLGGRAS